MNRFSEIFSRDVLRKDAALVAITVGDTAENEPRKDPEEETISIPPIVM